MSPGPSSPSGSSFETSLGPCAEKHGSIWRLDLTELPIFHGLSVLSRALGDRILEHTRTERIDVSVDVTVHPRENPELRDQLGVTLIRVCAEHEVVDRIVHHPARFQDDLRALFGTLQRKVYRDVLFPPEGGIPRALVFNFPIAEGEPSGSSRFVLERLAFEEREHSGLRVTIEDPAGRRLDLGSLPHVTVEDVSRRTFIAGSTRIAQSWTDGLRRETERGRRSYTESRKPYHHAFAQFRKAGLERIDRISVSWNDALAPRILGGDPAELNQLLKRVLLALEDQGIRAILATRGIVCVRCSDLEVYLDQSQLGRVLHLSLGQPRRRVDIGAFLERMPATRRAATPTDPQRPLRGVKVFLIHHITREVLGLIAALRRLGCQDLVTVFVAYAAEVPGSYLGALLELPADECRFLALTHVPDADSIEGRYRLASQYSPIGDREELAEALSRGRLGFFEAMQTVAVHEFLRQLERSEAQGEQCLLIEDGGYLGPLLQRSALEGWTARRLAAEFGAVRDDDRPLDRILAERVVGTVEHTRNGHDRIVAVEEQHGRLAVPAFSIAVSRLKVEQEAREVAASLLNAVENVLHASGRVLGRRHCLVLGSRGAIGSHLVGQLRHRLLTPARQLCGVDLQAPRARPEWPGAEVASFRDLPREARRRVDLVIGVTGTSVLGGEDVEEWLLDGDAPDLVLASGSTKTVEFAGLAGWLDGLLREANPSIGGVAADIVTEPLADPLTGRIFGQRYCFRLGMGPESRRRELTFLAGLTPVNFMFYGVPTEAIDDVIAQLLECALELLKRAGTLAPRLHAVDETVPAGEPAGARAAI